MLVTGLCVVVCGEGIVVDGVLYAVVECVVEAGV